MDRACVSAYRCRLLEAISIYNFEAVLFPWIDSLLTYVEVFGIDLLYLYLCKYNNDCTNNYTKLFFYDTEV